MRAVLKFYQKVMKTYPMTLQSVQTGVLMAAGDVVAQTVVEKRDLTHLDVGRVARFGGIGFCMVGPALFSWYGFMERYIGATSMKTVLKKVAADQLLFAPTFIVILVTTIGFTQGLSAIQIKEKLVSTYPDILLNNYKLWPAVQLCNFYLVPLEYRVVVVQVVAIFWNTYLSWKTNTQSSTALDEEPSKQIQ